MAPQLQSLPPSDTAERDQLISISAIEIPEEKDVPPDPFKAAKYYLSDSKLTIQLHDLTVRYVRKMIMETSRNQFPVQGIDFSMEELTRRMQLYEEIATDLQRIVACIAYWGGESHRFILAKALARVTDHLESESGLVIWNSLRWYPMILLSYASGIAALANDNYDNLKTIFYTNILAARRDYTALAPVIGSEILEIERAGVFKGLPGHERYHVPRSEYLFKLLQPQLDDDLFLGKQYEAMFDRFEVFLALVIATIWKANKRDSWGPVGRFGWKYRGREGWDNPLRDLLKEASELRDKWPPFQMGLFGTDFDLFWQAASEYSQAIGHLGWF